MRDDIYQDAVRFLVAGVTNTAVTGLIYFAALVWLDPEVSYAIAWTAGILFVMIFYPNRVFPGGQRELRHRIALAAITVSVFLFGLFAISALTRLFGDPILPFLATIAATTTLNFMLSRALLRPRALRR